MTLIKHPMCCFSSFDRQVLPRKALGNPKFQPGDIKDTGAQQEMGWKLGRLLLDSGCLATLSLPGSCDVWSWGERSFFSLVSW